jgi:predicted acetyltransferase
MGIGIAKKGVGKAVLKKFLKKHKGEYVYIPITQKEGSIGFGKKAIKEAKDWAKKRQEASKSLEKDWAKGDFRGK